MSPRSLRSSKANNETTPRKNQRNLKTSNTPLTEKFNKLSFTSPHRNVHSSPLSGSDKENYHNDENVDKKRKSIVSESAKKRLPFGSSNHGNIMEDDTSIASRTRTRTSTSRTPPRKPTTISSSPQKRFLISDSDDTDDENYRCKSSPKRINSSAIRSSPRLTVQKPLNSFDDQNKEVKDVQHKSPKKAIPQRTSSRSTTPQRKVPTNRLEAFRSEEHDSEDDFNDKPFELEEDSGDSESSSESVGSAVSKTSKRKNESRKKNEVETFEEEPKTSEIELLLKPITKLELEIMKEDARRRAETRRKRENNPLMKGYPLFHTSALPDVLLKREEQCAEIEHFIKQAVAKNSSVHNRSIYISGVPGTGKTACVSKVVQKLQSQDKAIKFTYVYVNGLELVKPQHVFSEIYNNIYTSSRPVASKTARDKLSKIFSFNDSKRIPILLVVDELDMLCTKSQDVVYDIFDWASTEEARLSVIAIANTLDLPERVLKQRVSSRMGYNRLTFQPYNFEEIKSILEHRIKKSEISYKDSAFGLISRKVAAVSGDLRKALEFIRRAIEIAVDKDEDTLTVKHATAAVNESLQSMPILFTKSLSSHQECLLRSIVQEIRATSLEELDLFLVYDCYRRNCLVMTLEPMEMSSITGLLSSLQRTGYIEVKSHGIVSRRISLKISVDEIDYLLRQMKLSHES